jgi:NAD(P)-dependent dehydrogenase (short-subunit alcohol dehydrogenase family)
MKNILIIGASSGIGAELTRLLSTSSQTQSQEQYKVFGSYNKTSPEILAGDVTYFFHDVMGETELPLEQLPEVIHGVVYTPGSIVLKPFARIGKEDFVEHYRLNVVGAIQVLQSVLPRLKKSGNASIVLFSTVAVHTGFNFHSIIGTVKGAIEGLTTSLSAELAPSIRVNCIAPSITDTPLASGLLNTDDKRTANAERHPLKRIGNPVDVANLAEFLLSDKSSWMTGQILHLDGGMSSIR